MIQRALVQFVAIAIAAQGLAAQSVLPRVSPAEARLSARGLQATTAVLQRYVDEGRIAGAVAAIARDGKVGYLASVGVRDLATRAPMDEASLFRIYSMTKTVTAVGAMMLHEQGLFSLDDPVQRFLPEFAGVRLREDDGRLRAPTRPINIRDLLLHTSGLNHRTSDIYREAAVRDRSHDLPRFVRNIVAVPLMEDPGTRFRYSEATTVLGRLIEIWSGQPLDLFFEQRIFEPLGMTDTSFRVEPSDVNRLAEVYGPGETGLTPVRVEEVPFTERPALLEGAVGLVSTAPDFLRFSQMLLDRGTLGGVRLLRAETVERMVENGLTDAARGTRASGWGLGNVSVNLSTGEYGWDGSAGTIFWNDPARGTVILLMTQSSPAFPDGLRQAFKSQADASILN